MKIEKSFNIQIWCGLREDYGNILHSIEEIYYIVDNWVDSIGGQCVTVTPTMYRYKNGFDNGFVIGFIQYPRFPKTEEYLHSQSFDLAKILIKKLNQNRLTITTPDKSYLIEREDL